MKVSRMRRALVVLASLALVGALACTTEVIREVPVEKIVTQEVVKEVPVDRIVEVTKETVRTVEIDRPVEVIKEVIREVQVPGETIVVEKEVVKTVEVPVEKTIIVEKEVQVIATRSPDPTTMRAANLGPVEFLDVAKSQSVNDTFNALMVTGLVSPDVTITQTLPEIASSWKVDSPGTTYTFNIRDDVLYHNGKKMVAEDIVYGWKRARDVVGDRGRCKALQANVTDYNAPDDRTFVLSTAFVSPVFFTERATSQCNTVTDPESISTIDVSPIYTGPYRFRKLVPGDKIEYELFPDHYDKQRLRGKPDTFISVPIEVDLTRLAALKAGEIDLIINVDTDRLDEVKNTVGLQLLAQPGGFTSSYLQLIFNYREGITKDKAIREAVQYSIDKDAINTVAMNGVGVVGCHPLPREHWAYVEIPCPERDPEKSKQILIDAGYELPVTLDWVPMFVPFSKVLAQVAKQSLAEGGINAEIRVLDTPTWFEQLHYGVACGEDSDECFGNLHKTFDLGDNWLGRTPDPDGMITNVFKTNSGTLDSGFSGNNETRFFDPEIEKLFKAGLSTLDREERKAIYKEIVEKIHFGEIPAIKLQTMPRFMGASRHVKDLLMGPRGGVYLLGRWEYVR